VNLKQMVVETGTGQQKQKKIYIVKQSQFLQFMAGLY